MRTKHKDPLPLMLAVSEELVTDQLTTNMNGVPIELTTWETMEDRDD